MEDVNTPKRQLVVVSLTSSSPQISCQLEAHYTIFPRIRSGNGVRNATNRGFLSSVHRRKRSGRGRSPSSTIPRPASFVPHRPRGMRNLALRSFFIVRLGDLWIIDLLLCAHDDLS